MPISRNPKPSPRPRLGLYGGSFDPVHSAHLEVARRAQAAHGLERVLFIPARHSPHKLGVQLAPDADRLALLEAAIADEPSWSAERLELDREGSSYSIDTVHALAERFPAHELFLIIGSDNLPGLPRWKAAAELLELVRPVIVTRSADGRAQLDQACAAVPAAIAARLRAGFIDLAPIPGSATDVRRLLQGATERPELVPEPAWNLIRERGLYGVAP